MFFKYSCGYFLLIFGPNFEFALVGLTGESLDLNIYELKAIKIRFSV